MNLTNEDREMTLSEALFLVDKDLIDILVSSGISCWTCRYNPKHLGAHNGGFICEHTKTFCDVPELNLCLRWREGRSEEQILSFDANGKWVDK